MSKEKTFDVVVLGGGPGGYTAAFRAADLGLSVALVERRKNLGGVCLNVGCIPSKTLLHIASVMEEVAEIEKAGVTFGTPDVDLDMIRAKKDAVIGQLTSGLDTLCQKRKVTLFQGVGMFVDDGTIHVSNQENIQTVNYENAVISSGSHAVMLPNMIKDRRIWDSTDALEISEIPEHLLIIGGGIIGLEMAQVYSALGSKITIVEMDNQIIPAADKDLVAPLFQKLKKRYSILTGSKVGEVVAKENLLEVHIEGKGKESVLEVDAILVAVGRRPNVEGLGLEKVGILLDNKGFVQTNEKLQTTNSKIFAVGDVVGEPMLAHKATHQAKVAAEVIAGHNAAFIPLTIPSIAYTNPEVAWVGLTEKEAKEKKIEYSKGKFPWGASGRALSEGASGGVTKVLFDTHTQRLIGAGICGLNGGELIHEAALAIEMGANAKDISLTVHAHPTLAETFGFACEIVDGSITDVLPPKR